MEPVVERILVPTDFSECATAALEYALKIAGPLGAKIDLMHVWEAPIYSGADSVVVRDEAGEHLTLLEYVRRQAEESLRRYVAGYHARGLTVEAKLVAGDPLHVLERASHEHDLLVIGTHGRRAIARLLLGSLAERVLHVAACPVLIVRAPGHAAHAPTKRD